MVRFLGPRDPVLHVRALGLDFPGPLGLAAGFDKDAIGFEALGTLGFSFVEVGTLTALPQPGNARPRMFLLPNDRAMINRMGTNNQGASRAANRLTRPRHVIVGVNIGRSRAVSDADVISDYAASTRYVAPVADYLVVNVSSPNTPGLRNLQAVDRLRPLLCAIREVADEVSPDHRVPLLVKIAPDLSDDEIDAIADLAKELDLDGIVSVNTTVDMAGLHVKGATQAGGLSGAPLKARAIEVLMRLRSRAGSNMVLISVGGIETPDDAWDRLKAGATLVQGYTGFIYGGPLWPYKIHRGLARRLRGAAADR
jgi:dihydroorotate dehydrogenase